VNLDALGHNVDEMAKHPFCALVAAGGMGEMFSLTVEEIVEVVRTTVRSVRGRMCIIAGAGFNAPIAADLARKLEKVGADGLMLFPPYYTNAAQDGLHDYYTAVSKASSLPLVLYSRDWAVFTPDMVARLADRIPTLAAWKDGQGDTRRYQRIMTRVGDRLAWMGGVGDDHTPAYFAIGVQAYTSSISNIAPKLSIALADAGLSGDFGRLNELLVKYVHPLYAIREHKRGYEIAVMKHAMEILGMKAGPVRPPLQNCTETEVEEIRQLLEVYKSGGFASGGEMSVRTMPSPGLP
jgi:5-dehydro-4-deoxyglucarate dehydratase